MARVVFVSTQFDPFTKGVEAAEVTAGNVFQLVRGLEELFPGIAREIEGHASIAVDGTVITAWSSPLGVGSEVTFFPRVSGG